jgi:hypothetical protein
MLFQIERQTERDDWDSLNAIQDPYAKAIEMLRIGNTEQADAYIRTAKAAAFTAKELTRNVDQRRVLTQLDKRYAEAKEVLQQNTFADSDTSLTTAMQDAMHPAEASAAGSVLPEDFGLDGLSRT